MNTSVRTRLHVYHFSQHMHVIFDFNRKKKNTRRRKSEYEEEEEEQLQREGKKELAMIFNIRGSRMVATLAVVCVMSSIYVYMKINSTFTTLEIKEVPLNTSFSAVNHNVTGNVERNIRDHNVSKKATFNAKSHNRPRNSTNNAKNHHVTWNATFDIKNYNVPRTIFYDTSNHNNLENITINTDAHHAQRNAAFNAEHHNPLGTNDTLNTMNHIVPLNAKLSTNRPDITGNVTFHTEKHIFSSDSTFHTSNHNVSGNITLVIETPRHRAEDIPEIPPQTGTNNIQLINKLYQQTCNKTSRTDGLQDPTFRWDDILLIVVFNNPIYKAIPFVEVLYRPYFPHIVYCGPTGMDDFDATFVQSHNISFIAYGETPTGHTEGALNYACLGLARQMAHNVSGYMFMADDVVIFPQKLKLLNTSKAWFAYNSFSVELSSYKQCNVNCTTADFWMWWKPYGNRTIDALHAMTDAGGLLKQCVDNLKLKNQGTNRVNRGISDFYYIPERFAGNFSQIVQVFRESLVFLEIAVPTTISCLIPQTEITRLSHLMLWGNRAQWVRLEPSVRERKLASHDYFHPAKWGKLLGQEAKEYRKFFCHTVYLVDNLQ